jgi:hypothetical protein
LWPVTARRRGAKDTLKALRNWANARAIVEDAKTARDQALYSLFDQLIAGTRVSPDVAKEVKGSL